MASRPSLIIYRDHLLSPSETFVRSQGESLQALVPYYVGSRRVGGLTTPPERTIVLNNGGWSGKLRELTFKLSGVAPRFVDRLKSIQPVLIHAHFGMGGALALPLHRSLDVPLIVTFHGYDVTVNDRYLRYQLSHQIYRRRRESLKRDASVFIAVSNFIREKLIARGFPEEKVIVHYIGIDTARFQPDPLIQRKPVVLFVGRLTEVKGCEYLIRAMTLVQRSLPSAELVLIGDGPLRSSLENLARQLLVRYRFLGVQNHDVVRRWLNRSSVFSVPSTVDRTGAEEAFGLVFAEAQAVGVPVVSFATGGIPEAVAHGETGFLAPDRDYRMLASYILQLLTDGERWTRMSRQGPDYVRQHFDLSTQTRRLEDIYARFMCLS